MPKSYIGQTLQGRSFDPGEDLSDADFSRADLRRANFTDCNLARTNFTDADVRGASFVRATLTESNFTRAKAGLEGRGILTLTSLSLLASFLSGLLATTAGISAVKVLSPKSIKTFTFLPWVVLLAISIVLFLTG